MACTSQRAIARPARVHFELRFVADLAGMQAQSYRTPHKCPAAVRDNAFAQPTSRRKPSQVTLAQPVRQGACMEGEVHVDRSCCHTHRPSHLAFWLQSYGLNVNLMLPTSPRLSSSRASSARLAASGRCRSRKTSRSCLVPKSRPYLRAAQRRA